MQIVQNLQKGFSGVMQVLAVHHIYKKVCTTQSKEL